MTDTVRVGIVGLGNIGTYHATHLRDNAEDLGIEVAGGMDVDPTARERFEGQFDAPAHGDADDLFAAADAVVVTTPNRFHGEYVTRALEAGLDVLCEKSLAHTLESAERIADAARDAAGFCMVGFQARFDPAVEVLRARREDGWLGDVHHVEANYIRRRGVPGRGTWFTDSEAAGGGALVDIGVHALDLALHVLGFPAVVEVSGTTRTTFGGDEDYAYLEMWGEDTDGTFDVEDGASAFLRCADGSTVSLEVDWAANRPPDTTVTVHGTDGGAVYDSRSGDLTLYESGTRGTHHHADTTIETRDTNPYVAEKRAFVESVRVGQAPEQNAVEEAMAVQRVVDAVYRSSECGEAVDIM